MAAAITVTTMSCVLLTPPKYDADGGVIPPPYIVPDQESPAFEATLQYNVADEPTFKVTVADVDVNADLQVRFCLRSSADSAQFLLATNPIAAAPTPDHAVTRTPIVVSDVQPCNRFPATSDTRFLYVKVAAPTAFVSPENGCDIQNPEITPYAAAFWRFTCDKPQ